jgi:hypothetical protein
MAAAAQARLMHAHAAGRRTPTASDDEQEHRQTGISDLSQGCSFRMEPDDSQGCQDAQDIQAGDSFRRRRHRPCRRSRTNSLVAGHLRDKRSHRSHRVYEDGQAVGTVRLWQRLQECPTAGCGPPYPLNILAVREALPPKILVATNIGSEQIGRSTACQAALSVALAGADIIKLGLAKMPLGEAQEFGPAPVRADRRRQEPAADADRRRHGLL